MLAEVVLIVAFLIYLSFILFKTSYNHHQISQVSYLIVPPAFGDAPSDPANFYLIIYELLKPRLGSKTQSVQAILALEVIADYRNGIAFIVTMPVELSEAINKHLIAYWPKLEIRKIKDGNRSKLPIDSLATAKEWNKIEQISIAQAQVNESLTYLFGSMSGLGPNELVGLQVLIRVNHPNKLSQFSKLIYRIIMAILKLIVLAIIDLIFQPQKARQIATNRAIKNRHRQNNTDRLFSVNLRTLVAAPTAKRLKSLTTTINAAVGGYNLEAKKNNNRTISNFINRRPYRPFLTTAYELANLYRFPSPQPYLREDLLLSRSTKLVASSSMKTKTSVDVVLGMNIYNEKLRPIGLSLTERQKHLLIIGGTGMGKSTMLGYAFTQDMLAGKGVAMIDPHGDLADQLLSYVPKSRISEVIYINPADISYPIGINLMELPKNLSDDELDMAKDFITEAIVSIFRKIFSEDESGGHRIEYILRNTIHTAFHVPDATLFTIHKLLTNDIFRSSVISKLEDDSLRDFWYGEFNKAGSYQRVKMIAGVTAKLGRFQRSTVTRRIIEQPKSTIDFLDIINSGKILICNLAKGSIGEDTSALIGMIVLAKIQLSSLQRSVRVTDKRPAYFLYVDEFQQFSSNIFSQLVSESRKFGLYLTLAEQTTAYQEERDSNILLANVGNIVCFRTAAIIDSSRIGPLYMPYVDKGDLSNLEPYNFYIRVSGEVNLEPLSGSTIVIKGKPKQSIKLKIIESSQRLYATQYLPPVKIVSSPDLHKVPFKRT